MPPNDLPPGFQYETPDPNALPPGFQFQPPPDYLTDIGHSVVGGAIRAPLHPLGLPGDIQMGGASLGQTLRRNLFGEEYAGELPARHFPTTMDLAHRVARNTGMPADYVGQTLPGRIAGGAVETAVDPASLLIGPGSLAVRLGTGAISGASSAVGEEVAGPVGGLVGGGVGSLAAGSRIERAAAQAARKGAPPTPTPKELEDALIDTSSGTPHIKHYNLPKVEMNQKAAAIANKLENAITSSKGASALRTRLTQIAKEEGENLTKEQKDALEEIANSGRLLEVMSSGWAHGYFTPYMFMALMSGELKYAAAGAGAAIARSGARILDRRKTVGKVEQAREDVLRTAPSGPGKRPPVPPRLNPEQIPAAVTRSVLGPSEQEQ